jgi:hypothetical protein
VGGGKSTHEPKKGLCYMGKSKVIQMKKADKSQEARQILKNGIVNGMCVEKLIQMTESGLVGNIDSVNGTNGTSHYFNRMKYVVAENERGFDLINYFFTDKENIIIATTSISIDHIDNISGCINKDNPDNVLDINIVMVDGAEITINVIY